MIITGPSKEMAGIIQEHDLGLIANGFSVNDIRSSILSLTHDQINRYKNNVDKAASKVSSEKSMGTFSEKVEKMCLV